MKTQIHIFTILLIASIIMGSCLKDEEVKLPYEGFQPVKINDDWQVSSPTAENMNSEYLDKAYQLLYNSERFVMARSLLVLRNGKIVGEAYPHDPADAFKTENIQSCTKSFTSILTGIALKEHLLDSVRQTFSSIYPLHFKLHEDKKNITIEDALTMKAGIDFINGDHTEVMYAEKSSSVEYVLSLPKKYEPGIVYHYNDGLPHLVSAAIQEKFGKPLSEFADQYLFKPMGINNWQWESAKDGVTFGAFSLYLTPRDIAKFGQLLLQNGKWGTKQLVDSKWIAEATKPRVTMSSPGTSYGYYFWVYPADGAYAAVGHGGQYIYVVPSKNLVMVYTAWPYTGSDMFDNFNELADLVLKSCR